MTKQADNPKSNKEIESEIERLRGLLEEEKYKSQEAKETLEAIRTGAVDGIVRSSPEGEQLFILKGSDQPYRNLIEEMSEGALLISESGTILYANIGFAGLVDAQLDKVIGTHVSDWVSSRNVEALNDIISGNRKNGRKVFEIAFQTTKQKIIPTQVSLSKILFGTVNASALVVTDLTKHMEGEIKRYTSNLEEEITQRKKAEKAFTKKQDELQTILDSSQGLVFYKDLENHFIRVNKAFAEIMGLPKEQLEGRSLFELYPNEQAEAFWSDDKQVIASGKAKVGIEEKMLSKRGLRWVQTDKIPYRDAEGNITGVIGFSVDITERKKAEETLRNIEWDLNRAQAVGKIGSWRLDTQRNDLRWSDENYRIFGMPMGTPMSYEAFLNIVHPEDRPYVDREWKAGLGGQPYDIEHRIIVDGKVKWVREKAELEFDKDGNLRGGFGTTQEITDFVEIRHRLEDASAQLQEYADNMEQLAKERAEKLKDAERLAAIGATAGMVGHDIRNPLQAIISDVFLAKTELASITDSEEKKNALESMAEIEKNIDYINKIVQDLQDYARPLNPMIEESDLESIVEVFITKNGLPKNIKVDLKIAEEARRIRADPYYLNRILFNLVTNAVQAMPNGGKLTIDAHKEADDTVLSVKDTGVGIPKEIQDKMFTLMFTTKSKGQGFGLPVVKRMTESLGGTVTFESEVEKGTTFTIRLPPPKELNGKLVYKK
jgi:PAS domain S-box-containing protein